MSKAKVLEDARMTNFAPTATFMTRKVTIDMEETISAFIL